MANRYVKINLKDIKETKLTIRAQDIFYNKVSEILWVILNLTPHTAKNALAKYKE